MAHEGYKALVKVESSAIAFTGEATTTSDNISYQISDTAKRIISYNSTVVVYDDGVATVEAYTISRLNGTITFDTADAGRIITVDGSYVVLSTVTQANSWSADFSSNMADATIFQNTSKAYKPTTVTAAISISKFYETDSYLLDMLLDGSIKVLELYYDNTESPIRVYSLVSSDSISLNIESLITESVSLNATGNMILEA